MTGVGRQFGSVALRYRRAEMPVVEMLPGRCRASARRWPGGASGGTPPPPATGTVQVSRRSRLEAVLFVAGEPLSLRKLAQSANLTDATEARTLLTQLRRIYDERGCAFQVEQVAGGHQLMTRAKFAPWLRPMAPSEREIRLSAPALETLAVVAYRQPVLRAEVEAIRGVACGEILRQLMDRDLLRIVGRSEELGRPLRYGTTRRFLEAFGLCSLDQLPLWSQLVRPEPSVDLPSESMPSVGQADTSDADNG
jgi:segregation and condensation protein B